MKKPEQSITHSSGMLSVAESLRERSAAGFLQACRTTVLTLTLSALRGCNFFHSCRYWLLLHVYSMLRGVEGGRMSTCQCGASEKSRKLALTEFVIYAERCKGGA